MSCPICLNDYTAKTRKEIKCQYCPVSSCSACLQQYILSSVEDCHCHACKRGWTTEFMNNNFPLSFRGKTLRMHRRTILLSREKSLLPAMQVYVEAKRNYNNASTAVKALLPEYQSVYKNMTDLMVKSRVASNDYYLKAFGQPVGSNTISEDELAESRRAYIASSSAIRIYKKNTFIPMRNLYNDAMRQVNRLYRIYMTGEAGTAAQPERREFLMHCPAPECRGFISSSYVCGTCTLKTCSDCLELVGEAHTCKPESIESAKAIKKETRSCPKCAARIFKIDGCDQMWCTMDGCNTAFSWNTGHIVSGRVHNPHYYEWLRRIGGTGGHPEREVGDIPCGGLPNQRLFVYRILDCALTDAEKNLLLEINRNLGEFEERLRSFPARMNALANKEVNVKYLMKEISEAEWQRQLEFTEAKFTRKKEIGQILQTFVTVSAEIMAAIYERGGTNEEGLNWIRTNGLPNLEALREYTNKAFITLGNLMKMAVPTIGTNWRWQPIRVHYRGGPPVLDVSDVAVEEL